MNENRPNSEPRWREAMRRAEAEGVQIRKVKGMPDDEWLATSASDPDQAYLVTKSWCMCQAAKHGDPVCKHRAKLHAYLGTQPKWDTGDNLDVMGLMSKHRAEVTTLSTVGKMVFCDVKVPTDKPDMYRIASVIETGGGVLTAIKKAIEKATA